MSGYHVGFVAGSIVAPRLVARVGHVRVFAALAALASTTVLMHALLVEPVTWSALRLATGFCYAGLYVVSESWLNARADNAMRGQLLAVYVALCLIGMALGQLLLNLADPGGVELFVLVSVLVSLGVVPMLLSTGPTPAYEAPAKVRLRRLLSISPLGVVGLFGTVMVHGAFFGMGPVYAAEAGFSVREISLFMSAIFWAASCCNSQSDGSRTRSTGARCSPSRRRRAAGAHQTHRRGNPGPDRREPHAAPHLRAKALRYLLAVPALPAEAAAASRPGRGLAAPADRGGRAAVRRHLNTLYVTTQGAYLNKDGANVVVSIDGAERARADPYPGRPGRFRPGRP
jgi:hypothetical protein